MGAILDESKKMCSSNLIDESLIEKVRDLCYLLLGSGAKLMPASSSTLVLMWWLSSGFG